MEVDTGPKRVGAHVEAALRKIEAEVRRDSLGELGLLLHGALPPGVIEGQGRMEHINPWIVALLGKHRFQQRFEPFPCFCEDRVEARRRHATLEGVKGAVVRLAGRTNVGPRRGGDLAFQGEHILQDGRVGREVRGLPSLLPRDLRG